MEERSKKTLEECKKLERYLEGTEKDKKTLEKKFTQVYRISVQDKLRRARSKQLNSTVILWFLLKVVSKVGKLVNELKEEKEVKKCQS